MTTDCSNFRSQIPKALLEELKTSEQQALESHLVECQSCARERDLYLETLQQLRSVTDVSVPRHFFVYPDESRFNPWQFFRQMTPVWKAVTVTMLLAMGMLSAFSILNLHVRAEGTVWTLRFGRSPEPATLLPSPSMDVQALKAELVRIVEEKSRKDNIEWMGTLRAELSKSNSNLTRQQRTLLETTLSRLESRVNGRILATATRLENTAQRSYDTLLQAVDTRRERDLAAVSERLNRITVTGEIKSDQTDAILETLLQVAELRLNNSLERNR